MTYRNRSANTPQADQVEVYLVGVPLEAGKVVRTAVLPDVRHRVTSSAPAMHVFALTIQ